MNFRLAISTLAELDMLDPDEILSGYRDGRAGEPEPGDNHSLSYWHGWRNGVGDRTGVIDEAQRKLAHAVAPGGKLRFDTKTTTTGTPTRA